MAEGTIKIILDPDTRKLDRALKGKRVGIGGAGGGKSQKKQEKNSDVLVGISKRVLASIAGIALVITSLDFIIKPLVALLTAILTLLFLPLVPVMKPLFKVLAKWIPQIAKFSQRASNIIQKLVDFFTKSKLGKFILSPFGFILDLLLEGAKELLKIGSLVINKFIKPGFKSLLKVGVKIWEEFIVPGFNFLLNAGIMLWQQLIRPGFEFFLKVGELAWNIIKGAFVFIKNKIISAVSSAANAIIRFVSRLNPFRSREPRRLAAGGIVTKPTLAVIGEKGPEAVVPLNRGGLGGNVTININNPIVRSNQDMKKIANEISKIFAQGKLRGFATNF